MPPELRNTPTPRPMPTVSSVPVSDQTSVSEPSPDENVDADEEPEAQEKKRSWFGRLFSRDESANAEENPAQESSDMEDAQEDEAPGNSVPVEEVIDNRYTLKIGDVLYITLSGSGGLSEQIETVIDEQGNVKLRFIGAVKAKGLSPTQLEKEIEAEYTVRQKIYKEIVVRVAVPNTFYFIGGEVRQPGRFPLIGRVTLSQAIVSAGNFTEWANAKRIFLVRDNERTEINFRDIKQNPNLDVELQPGDVITVDRSTF